MESSRGHGRGARDGWFYTGDLGYFDSGGNLFITGRRKEVIVLANAKNVYPEEIEAHYLRAQSVKEICVMAAEARPGDPTSERLHAVVVPNFELLRERKIVNAKEAIRLDIEALSHKIASTKRLGSYDIWQEDLPRTTTRKLKRFQIEQRVRELKQNDGGGAADVGKEKEKPANRRRAILAGAGGCKASPRHNCGIVARTVAQPTAADSSHPQSGAGFGARFHAAH